MVCVCPSRLSPSLLGSLAALLGVRLYTRNQSMVLPVSIHVYLHCTGLVFSLYYTSLYSFVSCSPVGRFELPFVATAPVSASIVTKILDIGLAFYTAPPVQTFTVSATHHSLSLPSLLLTHLLCASYSLMYV